MQAAGTIPCPIRSRAAATPELPALIGADGSLDYRGFNEEVNRAADRLRDLGIAEGDRVAIALPLMREHVVLHAALLRIGAVACPLNVRFPPEVLGEILNILSPVLCISGGDLDAHWSGIPVVDVGRVVAANASSAGPIDIDLDERLLLSRPFTVVFTSGSRGAPKGAIHAVAHHVYSALGSNMNIPVRPGDRWLVVLPLYHVGGLGILMRCWLSGAAVVVGERGRSFVEDMVKHDPTHISLVGAQMRRLLDEAGSRDLFPSLQAVLLGGSAIPETLVRESVQGGWPIHVSYGNTEMASQVTTSPPRSSEEDLVRKAGRLLPYRDLRIGSDGEIFVRGATRFLGYAKPGGMECPFDEGGWFATGDLGRIDANGWLEVVGRKDNRFISGGENIHPELIERALQAMPGIRRAVVVPVTDPVFGFRPVAFLEGDGASREADHFRSFLERKLPRYMHPVRYYPLPEDTGGAIKPVRFRLGELAERLLKDERPGAANSVDYR